MAPVFESVEDGPDCMDHVIKDNNLPGSALCIERGWGVEELELFLKGGLARLSLAEQQELRRRCPKPSEMPFFPPRVVGLDTHLDVLFRALEPLSIPPNFVVDTI